MLHFKYALKTDGATTVLLDLCEHMDPSRVVCDFLLGDKKVPEHVLERIRKIWPEGGGGGRIYSIEAYCPEKDPVRYTFHKILFCCRLIRQGHYDVVHVHTEDAGRSLILFFAWLMGVKGRVVHSHNSFTQSGRMGGVGQRLFKQLLPIWANGYLACSAPAARWMFPGWLLRKKKVVFLPNGIQTESFCFSETERQECRQELGLEGERVFALCAVGRLAQQKNLAFLLRVLGLAQGELRQKREQEQVQTQGQTHKEPWRYELTEPQLRLLLVGDGPERERLEELADKLHLSSSVLFLGERDDVPKILWASDLFLLPSFFEGLPRALVEAQAAGLPCLVSGCVTRQADLTGRVCYLPVKGAAERWARRILEEAASQWAEVRQEEARLGGTVCQPEICPEEAAPQPEVCPEGTISRTGAHPGEDIRQQRIRLRRQAALQVERSGFCIRDSAKKLERYYDRFQKSCL